MNHEETAKQNSKLREEAEAKAEWEERKERVLNRPPLCGFFFSFVWAIEHKIYLREEYLVSVKRLLSVRKGVQIAESLSSDGSYLRFAEDLRKHAIPNEEKKRDKAYNRYREFSILKHLFS